MDVDKARRLLGKLLELKFESSGDIFALLRDEADVTYEEQPRMQRAVKGLACAYHQFKNHNCNLEKIGSAAQISLRRGSAILAMIMLDTANLIKGVDKQIPRSENERLELIESLEALTQQDGVERNAAYVSAGDLETSKELSEIFYKLKQARELTRGICKNLGLSLDNEIFRQ